MNVVSNESTPFLIGMDVTRGFGLVIDYHNNRVYSHTLKRYFPCAILPTGHLALEIMPSNSEWRQRPVSSQALSTWRWDQHSRAQEKGTLSFDSSTFHLRDEESEHEDDLLKLSGMPETRTRFDKRAKTYRTPSSSGPLWKTLIAQITIDDKIGHIMSLEFKKHTNEKDLYWNLPSVCDIRTLLLHCSLVTPNQQLKQSFQMFAAIAS